jgi:hypothetical protein
MVAIIVTGLTYLSVAVVIGMVVLREALSQPLPVCLNNTYTEVNFPPNIDNYCDQHSGFFNPVNASNSMSSFYRSMCKTLRSYAFTDNSTGHRLNCSIGLIADYDCLTQVSILPPIIYAGVFQVN